MIVMVNGNAFAASECIKVDKDQEIKFAAYSSLGDATSLVAARLPHIGNCTKQKNYIDCEYIDASGIRYLVEGSEIQRIEVSGKNLFSLPSLPLGINGYDDINKVFSKIKKTQMTWTVSFHDDEIILQPENCFINDRGADSFFYIVFYNNRIKKIGVRQNW